METSLVVLDDNVWDKSCPFFSQLFQLRVCVANVMAPHVSEGTGLSPLSERSEPFLHWLFECVVCRREMWLLQGKSQLMLLI